MSVAAVDPLGRPTREVIPQRINPTLLGPTFDPMFTFNKHAENTKKKAKIRLNVLRALSDTSFGQDRACLLLTYKELIRPFCDNATPLLYPIYSPTLFNSLQRVQNQALCLVTGAHRNSSVDFLHQEAAILPVEAHMKLRASQFHF